MNRLSFNGGFESQRLASLLTLPHARSVTWPQFASCLHALPHSPLKHKREKERRRGKEKRRKGREEEEEKKDRKGGKRRGGKVKERREEKEWER